MCENCMNPICCGCTDTENDKGRVMVKVVQREIEISDVDICGRVRRKIDKGEL